MIIEKLCVHYPNFGRFYHRIFYAPTVEREITLARLEPGERVLHIGGGGYPFTSLQLANYGCSVCLIDNDAEAAENAKRVVAMNGLSDLIQVVEADGMEFDGSGFDVIWLSLLVQPKEEIVKKLLVRLSEQERSRIIYRNPRGLFKNVYPHVNTQIVAPEFQVRFVLQSAKEKSVMISNKNKSVEVNLHRQYV